MRRHEKLESVTYLPGVGEMGQECSAVKNLK